MSYAEDRRFLFLQGPHGPWFHQLSRMLLAAGAEVWRVGFNLGDQRFWPDRASFIPWQGRAEDWPAAVADLLARLRITDLVVYGDTRPIHAEAVAAARAAGLRVHVFEEGYLRPYWITYERGGANGHSRLMDLTLAQMRAALAALDTDMSEAPSTWGDMRQHIFWGAAYHWFVLTGGRRYRNFRPHRALTVRREFLVFLRRLILMPLHGWRRARATRKIRLGGFPYHLALLQLEHDSSFQMHSPFSTMAEFLELVIRGFAAGAPGHHHLVFKAHPLEDGRVPVAEQIRHIAQACGIAKRVHFVPGGKLAQLLNGARSAVTVNSTSGQQALWRGLPLKCFGASVYAKPEFVSPQSIDEFFRQPLRPDGRAYREYRRYLLETSQVAGGYYSSRGRRALLRQIVDMMLSQEDPYEALVSGNAAPRQQLRLVK